MIQALRALPKILAHISNQIVKRSLSSSTAPVDTEVVVIGAGVIGLAIARQLALAGKEVVLLDSASYIGTETSSRNSGVIHAGIYYPEESLKARLCVQGKHMLYQFCLENNIPHQRIGKLLVATSEDQLSKLELLKQSAAANGVTDLQPLTGSEAKKLEPNIKCAAALLSPSTGIIDVHAYMMQLERHLTETGRGILALNSRVLGGNITDAIKQLSVLDTASETTTTLSCHTVVNAAGIYAQQVSKSLVADQSTIPPLQLCKGNYFELQNSPFKDKFRHLIYPLPSDTGGLGIHLTLDLAGAVRFGPDTEWLPESTTPDSINYQVDPSRQHVFKQAITQYLDSSSSNNTLNLVPGYSGVRPKVAGGDFIIQQHAQGFVSLYGIESPGLTASLALAQEIADRLV